MTTADHDARAKASPVMPTEVREIEHMHDECARDHEPFADWPERHILQAFELAHEHRATLLTAYKALAARNETLERLDREAATHVEAVIAMRTDFTGEQPYVGWKGLGLALNEALDERDKLKAQASPAALEGVDDLERKAQWLWRLTGTGTKRWMDVPEVARIRFREKAAEYETAFGLTAFPALMGPTEENKNG